jgi:hypothetical protein
MARGSEIIVYPGTEPNGHFKEGIVNTGQTLYPGMVVQEDPTQALQGGRFVWKIYDADADGGRPKGELIIILADSLQGKTVNDPYAAGDRCFGYVPCAGDELNLLILNIAGTADDHAAGEMLIPDDTTGKFIATTGSPELECAQLLETITDPVADTLAWCKWTGY